MLELNQAPGNKMRLKKEKTTSIKKTAICLMDPFVNEAINSQSGDLSFRSRQSSGLTTPQTDPFSPFPTSCSNEDLGLSRVFTYGEKVLKFKRYMNLVGVETVKAAENETSDADEFYNDDPKTKTCDVRYVQRPYEFSSQDDITLSESVANCYDTYDIHRKQEVRRIHPSHQQPALRYDDSLIFEKWDKRLLVKDTDFMAYKMNLTECFDRYLFVCSYDTIIVLKDEKEYKKFATRPTFTTREHMDASVIPFAPHSINYIKLSTFKQKKILIVCYDDGRAVLYDLDKFLEDEELHLIIQIKLSSSVWGADSKDDFIAFSDNSHTISLFFVKDKYVYNTKSLQLIHNIPALEIVSASSTSVYVSCTCISGELVTFEFNAEEQAGAFDTPIEEPLIIDTLHERPQLRFKITHKVINRLMLQENGWTVNHVHEEDFKEVHNPEYLGAESEVEVIKVLKKSRALGLLSSHLCTSDLGGAADFEDIHVHTRFDSDLRAFNRLNTFTDKFKRIKKAYLTMQSYEGHSSLGGKYLVVTTVSKIGLFRADSLICNSDTGDMFDFQLPGELDYSNRLSITRFIPELSTIIAASQAGFFTIFRLVKHRGLHALREEYVVPFDFVPEDIIDGDTITGIGVKKVDNDIFWIYVSYRRAGSIQKYEIRQRSDDVLDVVLV